MIQFAAYKMAQAFGASQIGVGAAVARHSEVITVYLVDTFDVAPKTAPAPPTAAQKTLNTKSVSMLELIEVNGTPGSQLSTPRSGKSPSPSPTSPGSLRKQRVRNLRSKSP
uniref:Uncharacterized protein n=1 Tax=Sphaerodactylus townsendi TaxID=933632 RepID=A0ACB8FGV3_9SAUR